MFEAELCVETGWKLGSGIWAVTHLGQHGATRVTGKAGLDGLRGWPPSLPSNHPLGAGLDSALTQRPQQVRITCTTRTQESQPAQLCGHRPFAASLQCAGPQLGAGERRAWPWVSGRAMTPPTPEAEDAGHPRTQTGRGRGRHKAPPPGAGLSTAQAGALKQSREERGGRVGCLCGALIPQVETLALTTLQDLEAAGGLV